MGALQDKLLAPGVRPQVVADCVRVVEQEVDGKGGLTGMAIKAAYAMVKAVGPTIVRDAMDNLLNDFAGRLEPFYEDHKKAAGTTPLGAFMSARAPQVANALLGITDDRAKRTSGTLKKAYEKLRPTGQKHVEEAVPRIAGVIQKHAG